MAGDQVIVDLIVILAGAVIGVILLIALIAGLITLFVRRSRRRQRPRPAAPEWLIPPHPRRCISANCTDDARNMIDISNLYRHGCAFVCDRHLDDAKQWNASGK